MKFQIWYSVDGSEGTTCLASEDIQKDLDGRPMMLLHQFEADGHVNNVDDVKRAFAYSNKWMHDEGKWPVGCRPLDNNRRLVSSVCSNPLNKLV